jgi:hypothetical protein
MGLLELGRLCLLALALQHGCGVQAKGSSGGSGGRSGGGYSGGTSYRASRVRAYSYGAAGVMIANRRSGTRSGSSRSCDADMNTCSTAADGVCNELDSCSGDGSCEYGTDCTDCHACEDCEVGRRRALRRPA